MKTRTQEEQIAHFHSGCAINEDAPKKCLEWQRGLFTSGYGAFGYQGNVVRTHRLAYELFHGRPIAEGMFICHSCDNPKCVTPAHLTEGTQQQNMDDMTSRNRQARLNGETNGSSKLTAVQVLEIREKYEKIEDCTHRSLANEYGVSKTTITDIISNKHWTHL